MKVSRSEGGSKYNLRYYSDNQEYKELFEDDEDKIYRELTVTPEGTEDINGVSALKLKVDYIIDYPKDKLMTRESLIDNYYIEEDVIDLFEGMSDAVDAFVNATREKQEKGYSCTEIYYISEDDHQLLRREYYREYNNIEKDIDNQFFEYLDRYDAYSEALIRGKSEEEALESAKNLGSSELPGHTFTVSTSIVNNYMINDACDTMPELPQDAMEITEQQYSEMDY